MRGRTPAAESIERDERGATDRGGDIGQHARPVSQRRASACGCGAGASVSRLVSTGRIIGEPHPRRWRMMSQAAARTKRE